MGAWPDPNRAAPPGLGIVWLKSYQRLGYFPKLADVPDVVVEHVRRVLDLAEDVPFAQHESARTAKWHRQLVREFVGVVYEPARVRTVGEQAIRKAVQTKDNPADLINVALEELVHQRCELPGYSTLDTLAASIRTEVNTGLFARVAGRMSLADRARLQQRLLVMDPTTRRSGFDRLKDPAKAATLGKFKARLAYLQELDDLGATEEWLRDVPPGKIAHFAGEARVTDLADLRKVGADKQWTLIASLIHVCRTTARDEVVTMFCKRMAVIHKKAREHLEELHDTHRAESERLLGMFGDVLSVVREAVVPPEPDIEPEHPPGPRSWCAVPHHNTLISYESRWRPSTRVSGTGHCANQIEIGRLAPPGHATGPHHRSVRPSAVPFWCWKPLWSALFHEVGVAVPG
ncbi:DUF4158 domain-containing protein [Saccharopolyspora sp. 5N708]|uniref:DUF4158 domain-containing protein n=1 Tax=Saccharopolyspora sp. 5N708 TaxID=3457424 RepID=UPI003FD4731B